MRRRAINRFARLNGRSRAEWRVYLANRGAEVLSAVRRGIFIEPHDIGFFESSFRSATNITLQKELRDSRRGQVYEHLAPTERIFYDCQSPHINDQ